MGWLNDLLGKSSRVEKIVIDEKEEECPIFSPPMALLKVAGAAECREIVAKMKSEYIDLIKEWCPDRSAPPAIVAADSWATVLSYSPIMTMVRTFALSIFGLGLIITYPGNFTKRLYLRGHQSVVLYIPADIVMRVFKARDRIYEKPKLNDKLLACIDEVCMLVNGYEASYFHVAKSGVYVHLSPRHTPAPDETLIDFSRISVCRDEASEEVELWKSGPFKSPPGEKQSD